MVTGEPAGLIVAGGRSRRFGDCDKAVVDLGGVPMIRRVADRLAPAISVLIVNCRTEQVPAIRSALVGYDHPVRFARENVPDNGPVAGIATGLDALQDDARNGNDGDEQYAFVAACDMPLIDSDVVAHLFKRARGHDAAVPRSDGQLQPLHAVYRLHAMVAACESALAAGRRTARAPLDTLDAVVVEKSEIRAHGRSDTFENVNTKAALAAVADRIE